MTHVINKDCSAKLGCLDGSHKVSGSFSLCVITTQIQVILQDYVVSMILSPLGTSSSYKSDYQEGLTVCLEWCS